MEETKTPTNEPVSQKTNQTYLIAIIGVAVLVVIIVIILSAASPKTPFDGLKDYPDRATVIKRYGENYTEYFGELNVDYYWCDTNGRLSISFEYGKAVSANWHSGSNKQLKAKITALLDKKFGAHTQVGDDYIWNDKAGNTYKVEMRSWGLHVYFNP